MAVILTLTVSAPFTNTYASQTDIEISKDWRYKKGATFITTLEDDKRYFIESTSFTCVNGQLPIGRWISKQACSILNREEFSEADMFTDLPYDGEACDTDFQILGTVRIAKSLRQNSTIPVEDLPKGDIITSKFRSIIMVNGKPEIRYLIDTSPVSEYEGCWLVLDKGVAIISDQDQATSKISVEQAEDIITIAGLIDSKDTLYTNPEEYAKQMAETLLKQQGLSTTSTPTPTSADSNAKNKATTSSTSSSSTIPELNVSNRELLTWVATGGITKETVWEVGTVVWELLRYEDGSKKLHKYERGGALNEYVDVEATATVDSIRRQYGIKTEDPTSEDDSTEFEDSSLDYEFGGGDYTSYIKDKNVNLNTDAGIEKLYQIYELSYPNSSLMDIPLDRMNFIHGMPFQFSEIADRRRGSANGVAELPGTSDMYGLVYAREILAMLPIAVFAPGKPQFLSKLKSGFFGATSEKTSIKDLWMPLIQGSEDTVEGVMQQLQLNGGDYDYYTLNINTAEYYDYVNLLCRMSARNMGLVEPLDLPWGARIPSEMDWSKYNIDVDANCKQDSIMAVLGMNSGVAFVFDPQSSISDSLGNNTTESQLAGMLNQITSTAREMGFLMGQATGANYGGLADTDWDSYAKSYKEGITGGKTPVIDSIGRYLSHISKGLNVRFPEIWNDSTHSKSYSIDMHFISPYANRIAVWRHVLVPFWHIFALAAPQSKLKVGVYDSPFLIRAFSKGYFNVEMGIIDSLSYKRFGDGDMITANGIPTQIDVTVDFKDLYHTLTISPYRISNMGLFFNNTGLMDLIGTLSGVNMNRLGLSERLSLYVYAGAERVRSLGSNMMNHVRDRARGIIDTIYYGI